MNANQRTISALNARLSLRAPQSESLKIVANILEQIELSKTPDMAKMLSAIRQHYPTVKAFERDFPSLCFALATGVGKTRLMGAFIAYLYLTGRSRHFFVLAPNLTIYEKLQKDFDPGSPKYVFKGLPEFAQNPPLIINGENYDSGIGVRYEETRGVTRQLFGPETAPHINIFNISKINARDNKKSAAKSTMPRMRRLQEYIGESYFDYLAELDDLVVLMDEAHRYYASAGAQALNDLKPILGLELTATPKTIGNKPREFLNIVYHYPLAAALQDNFVKIPAVATRKDFRPEQYSAAELEKIKLEDGIHHHEFVKVELETYALSHSVAAVKPFMLVVAQDTRHAGELRALIESDEFFEGRYKNKVIEVHSNQSGEESDEAMQRLLAVEHDADTEIVIHVNKLKEGWDVTNLYTIVPLRASASEILTEQTIGRGLRLPYGKRTGVESVDRLTIIAHDRFQDILDRANDLESIIRKTVYIGSGDDADIPLGRPSVITVPPLIETLVTGSSVKRDEQDISEQQADKAYLIHTQEEQTIARITLDVVKTQERRLDSSESLKDQQLQAEIARKVEAITRERLPVQQELPGLHDDEVITQTVERIVRTVTNTLAERSIDVPNIVVLPTRDVTYGFHDFELTGLDRINYQPVEQELLLQHLHDNKRETVHWSTGYSPEDRQEDYLIRRLIDIDAIDYDSHADLLYKLAGQLVEHLQSYLFEKKMVENVLIYYQKSLVDFIWAQMRQHLWQTPTDYTGKVTQGFSILKPLNFSMPAGEQLHFFREPLPNNKSIRQTIFRGFRKCCYSLQKFDSAEGELRLAMILEDDNDVLKWMKPAPGQFRIEYQRGQSYEPDFVIETKTDKLIIEPKRADQMEASEVQEKTRAALRWCEYANQHAAEHNGKKWHYLLVPHNEISLGRSVSGLLREYAQ